MYVQLLSFLLSFCLVYSTKNQPQVELLMYLCSVWFYNGLNRVKWPYEDQLLAEKCIIILIICSFNFRPAMIKYGIDNIRDLIGPKIDLAVVQRNPVCRIGH